MSQRVRETDNPPERSLQPPKGARCKWVDDPDMEDKECGRKADTIEVVKCHDYTFEGTVCVEHKFRINRILMRHGFNVAFTRKANGTKQKAYVAASGLPFKAADVRRWLQETGRVNGTLPTHGRVSNEQIQMFADLH